MPAAMGPAFRAMALAALVLAGAAPAGAEDVPPIEPSRPSRSTGARTVPPGTLQLETGVEYAHTRVGGEPDERSFSVQATLRLGVTDRLELRVDGEPLVRLRGADDDTGPGDLVVAAKYRVLVPDEGSPWPALSLQPSVKIPIARQPIGSERVDAGVLAIATLDLPAGFGLDVNAGLTAVGQPHGYLLQGFGAASIQRDLVPERLSGFAEVFVLSREDRDGRHQAGVDAGLVYRITRTLAADVGIETTFSGRGPEYALRAGLSVRVPR